MGTIFDRVYGRISVNEKFYVVGVESSVVLGAYDNQNEAELHVETMPYARLSIYTAADYIRDFGQSPPFEDDINENADREKNKLFESALDAVQWMYNRILRSGNPWMKRPPEQDDTGGYEASVRGWGDWEVPPDAEDDGDYDWKQLTDRSNAELSKIEKEAQGKFPGIKLSVGTGEKEWIYIQARIKK